MISLLPGLVSAMMPAYNAGAYIEEAIRSVLAQRYTNWELLVVDDGSTDETAAVVSRFDDPRIRLFRKPNGGESSARNLALEHSRGEFIAYLDADDAWLPDHLAVTVAFLRGHPQVEAVYTDGFHMDGTGRKLASLQSRRRGPFQGRIYDEVVRASDVFGPPMCVLVRHETVARHHLRYDSRIVIGPDWDFFVRLADVATFGYLAQQTGFYRVHASNISTQVGAAKRAASLTLCRQKAIAMPAFAMCAVDVRVAAFYDLLVNLLRSEPDQRPAALEDAAFAGLPPYERARLLRLTAVDAILHGANRQWVGRWLDRACDENPRDRRAWFLATVYGVSPSLCEMVLRLQQGRTPRPAAGPFADLAPAGPSAPAGRDTSERRA